MPLKALPIKGLSRLALQPTNANSANQCQLIQPCRDGGDATGGVKAVNHISPGLAKLARVGWDANHTKASNSKRSGDSVGKLAHILHLKQNRDPKADGILWKKETSAMSSAV